ncbi:MAG: RpiB/LacA/LacB family sugar-phosphate isomerase [Deltaproteobacteria bacterium]|nr:RpiB/LacA/LacB family sugar-phosphate isomerase [Deltaproteobacteria bacterium]
MNIVMGADGFGFDLKEAIKQHLLEQGHLIDDLTPVKENEVPYYEVGALAALKVQQGKAERGIIFCGTGMGVAIVANKFRGIYASVVESEFAGLHCKVINNSNILSLGGMIVAPYRAKRIVDQWLAASFTEGYPEFAPFLTRALAEIKKIEAETMK